MGNFFMINIRGQIALSALHLVSLSCCFVVGEGWSWPSRNQWRNSCVTWSPEGRARGHAHCSLSIADFKELPGPGNSDNIAIDSSFECNSTAGAWRWNVKLQVCLFPPKEKHWRPSAERSGDIRAVLGTQLWTETRGSVWAHGEFSRAAGS